MQKKATALILIFTAILSTMACTEKQKTALKNTMTKKERASVTFGEVSSKQKYYDEVEDVAHFISEMSIYDEELDSTYIIHITLPPNYDDKKFYPMYLMTDGIYRLSDHAELRPMMVNGEIKDIILVSVGLDYGIDAESPAVRKVEFAEKNDLFLGFISDNLVPYLSEIYKIDFSRSALMGHSLGGLFAYYAMFSSDKHKNSPFRYYVAASPSLWVTYYPGELNIKWKHGSFTDFEGGYFIRNRTLNKRMFLTVGEIEEKVMISDAEKLVQRAKSNGVNIDFKIYPNGTNESFVKQMLRDSLLKFYGKDGRNSQVVSEKITRGAWENIPDYSPIKTGSVIPFGGYEWRVLDIENSKALILSKNILIKKPFHFENDGNIIYETSDLRKYLNEEFFDIVFNSDEKARIIETRIVNGGNLWYGTPGNKDTMDKVFLLSAEEVVKYFGDSGQLTNRPGKEQNLSDEYNTARIAKNENGNTMSWWLRTLGGVSYNDICITASYVRGNGEINFYGSGFSNSYGIRPAMVVNVD